MENKRFFTVLNGMLESGLYNEERFRDVLDDLDVPTWKVAILDEVEVKRALPTEEMLEFIEYIRTGSEPMVKKELLEGIRRILKFRYEFYHRSKKRNEETDLDYYMCTQTTFLSQYFDTYDSELETLHFEFDPFLPVEFNLDRLDQFRKSAELVIKHYHGREKSESLIPMSLLEFGLTRASGKKTEDLFDKWRRYLKVWDLVEKKEESQRTAPFYSGVGKTICKEFGVYKDYTETDLRANIRKDYRKACDLIISAEAGTFPIPPTPAIDPETLAGL